MPVDKRYGGSKWDKFIHPYEDKDEVTHYAVAQRNETTGQYIAPLDRATQQLTGCSSEFATNAAGIGGGLSLDEARRRARYLYRGI